MKSRRLISLLVVLTSILLITGCSGSKEIKFPAEKEDIEQAISKYNLSWTVEEERLEDAELSTSGQGKVFAINMDNKQLGELTTIKKDDIKFISLILYGKPEDDNQDDEKHFAEYEKEDWENIFLLISDLYGETKYASEAYRDMMDFYTDEKQDDDEQKNILFSDDYENLYYNVWFREKGKNETYTSDDYVTETESIDWDNAATIALSNQAGSEFFLEGLSRYIEIE